MLDFGKSYYFGLFSKYDTRFHAPEQLSLPEKCDLGKVADTDIMADVFAFSLVRLDLLVGSFSDVRFADYYKLDKVLTVVLDEIM